MKIWIDLANSPHVVFFLPLIRIFEEEGHRVEVTMRDFAQTVPLADTFGVKGEVVGRHGGASVAGKLANLLERTHQLMRYSRGRSLEMAVSHNSYAHVLAARLAGVKTVTLMDFEGQPANHVAFRAAHRVIVPDCFPDAALRGFGARSDKVHSYDGFKEQVYLSDFTSDPAFVQELRASCRLAGDWSPESTILVVARTPATMAAYHRFDAPLFDELMSNLDRRPEVTAIVLPRTEQQKQMLRSRYANLLIPDRALDGRQLVSLADLVISAGGTMNREAAILGTPTCTLYAGRIPAVDQRLIELGRMTAVRTKTDLMGIRYERKRPGQSLRNPSLAAELARAILS